MMPLEPPSFFLPVSLLVQPTQGVLDQKLFHWLDIQAAWSCVMCVRSLLIAPPTDL